MMECLRENLRPLTEFRNTWNERIRYKRSSSVSQSQIIKEKPKLYEEKVAKPLFRLGKDLSTEEQSVFICDHGHGSTPHQNSVLA